MRGSTKPRELWANIRHAYLMGTGSCSELAEKYGVSTSAVLSRCKREAWKRQLAETGERLEQKLEVELTRRVKTLAERAELFIEKSAFNAEGLLELVERALQAVNHRDLDALTRLASALRSAVDVGRKSFGLDSAHPPQPKLLAPTVQIGISLVGQEPPPAIECEDKPAEIELVPDTGAADQNAP